MSEDAGRLVGGRYRLGEVLGRGGMGTVWRGQDEILGRTVAVKELRFPSSVDEEEKQRLITRTLREAKAIARIRSGSAVTVFDVVNEDSRPWIVMELVEGHSLADKIKEDGPLEPQRAAEVGLAILDVLRAAHREGILHRDVKPSNVLLEDVTGRVVLTDFGIAKVEGDPSVTSTGMLVGAPSYISPERARGKPPGPPADLWSLGGLLFAAVEGRPPYDKGSAISTLTAVMTEPVPVSERAGELSEVIAGLLVKDPDKRLDVDGARVLLEPVAYGVVRGGGAKREGGEATRTALLPPVPSQGPGPSVSPSGGSAGGSGGRRKKRAENGGSADRLRGALKSVRNAAGAAGGAVAGGAAQGTGNGTGNGTGAGNGSGVGTGTGTSGRGASARGSSGGAHAGGRRDAGSASGSGPGSGSGVGSRGGAPTSGSASSAVPPAPTTPPAAHSFRKTSDSGPRHGGANSRTPAQGRTGAAGTAAGGGAGSGEQQGNGVGSGSRALPPESGGSGAIMSLRDLRELPELRKGVPRRVLLIGVAVVIAVVVVIVLIATAASGGGDEGDKGGSAKGSSQQDDEGDTDSGDQQQGEAEKKEPDEPEKKPEEKPEKKPKSEVPEGYERKSDGKFHFSMALPKEWKRTGIAGQNSGGKYAASEGGYPRIQVDYNNKPTADAAEAWRGLEPAVRKTSPGYRALGIEGVSWRGYPTVADWRFTRTQDGGTVRVLNRGFKVDGGRGYAIMITCKAGGWEQEACKTLRETAFKTFKPLG